MELIYSANKPRKCRREYTSDERVVCSLSPKNLVAFSSTTDLHSHQADSDDEDEVSRLSRSGVLESSHHVYVCDIDHPWDVTHLCSSSEPQLALQWHVTGTQLLVATETGICSVWQMKDYMINEWQCTQTVNLGGEEVVTIAWLHQGTRVTFNSDKKDSSLYQEKITKSHFNPSLSSYGGKPLEGWIAITATGMVCVSLCKEGSQEPQLVKDSLMSSRSRVSVADLAFLSSGDILVVVSDGHITSAIQCYRISLSAQPNNTCKIKCQVTAGFFAKCHIDHSLRESPTSRITHVKYMHEEDGDVIIVGAGDTNNSHVELWNQTTEVIGIHRLYQGNANPDSTYSAHRWVHQSSITHISLPSAIAVPRFPVLSTHMDPASVLFQYVAVAYLDGSVKLVDKHNFQPMTTTNLDMGITDLSAPLEKRRKTLAYMTHMQQSFTGCVLVGLDQHGCLYAMKVVNTRDPVTQVTPMYLVGMLEYSIVTMRDWWDILTALRPGVIETVIQRLTDNFSKQPPMTQEMLYHSMMAVKGSLLRCSSTSGGQQRAADCHCRLLLHSISQLFKSMLRPKAVSAQEMSAAEKLTTNCNKSLETDINKVMVTLNLEKKEFVVEGATLQNLQQLIQWVGDLTLYLLTSLPPMSQGYSSFPGHSLLRDTAFLGLLREVLVVIRIWGLINQSCMPHFSTTSTSFDSLSHFFKLLTRIWVASKEGGGSLEFEEGLLDECCLLSSQVLVHPVDEGLFGDMNYGSSIFTQPHPVQFVFGEVPSYVNRGVDRVGVVLPEGQTLSRQRKDIVRLIYLGRRPPANCRQCSRCGCLSLHRSTAKSPAIRAWELRFTKACPCGGQWTLVKPKRK